MHASANTEPKNDKPEFGYTRKDAIIIGVVLIASGYGLKWGLELAGVPDLQAGVYAEMAVFLLLCFGWVSTYIFRVATKKMTYVQQLQQYEEAVMKKRLEEMTEEELKTLQEDLEKEKKQG